MTDHPDRERFIPIPKTELVECLSNSNMVAAEDRETFLLFSRILDSIFHFEFHGQTEALKDESYFKDRERKDLNFNPGKISGKDITGSPVWTAVSLSDACERLDFMWDNFFQMHSPNA